MGFVQVENKRICVHSLAQFRAQCRSSRKSVVLFLVSSCYQFGPWGIVSVVCSIVLSRVSSYSCETLRELLPDSFFFKARGSG